MRKNMCKSKMSVDYLAFSGKEPVMVEITPAPERNHLKIFMERMMHLLGIPLQKKTGAGYRIYGKYRVKETFAGGANCLDAMLRRNVNDRKEGL